MKKLGKAHNKYTSMKNSLVSKSKPEDKGLFLVDENFPQTLAKLCTLEKGDKDGTSLQGRSAIGDRRRAIKDRAIGGIPNKTRKRPVESESEDEMWSYGSTSFSKTPKKAKATRGRGRGRGRGRERGKGKRKKQVGKIGDFFEGSEQF